MKIESIKISNVLSFKHEPDIEDCPEIQFDQNLNILIGPNGAGKSNFLEILNQIFQNMLFREVLFSDTEINISYQMPNSAERLKRALALQDRKPVNLSKNRNSLSNEQAIKLKIRFNNNDIINMEFVYKNAKKINQLISKYSNLGFQFDTSFDLSVFTSLKSIELFFESKLQSHPLALRTSNSTVLDKFIYTYLEYFEAIQSIITIANKHENEDWQPLKNTFALIGCYRNYNTFSAGYSLEQHYSEAFNATKRKIREQSTRQYSEGEPPIFELIKKIITFRFNEISYKHGNELAQMQIKDDELVKNINALLKKQPLNLELNADRPNNTSLFHEIYFKDNVTGKRVNVEELSAGQKAVLHFIFSIYGFDLNNGLLVIDEPELHLHPQIQAEYLQIVEGFISQFDIQFVLVTHSPVFIKPNNIEHVMRFYLQHGYTNIVRPRITESEKELMRIINFSNAAKIFFSKKIILVEGESDEYFYRFFLSDYENINNIKTDIEIINIQGKGGRNLWKSYLEKYYIGTFFIGDWDNVKDLGLISQSVINDYAKKLNGNSIGRQILRKDSNDRASIIEAIDNFLIKQNDESRENLKDLRDYLINRYVSYKDIIQSIGKESEGQLMNLNLQIEDKRSENIFILQNGELEDYLGVRKGIENIISFTECDYKTWKIEHPEEYNELNGIFDCIVTQELQ